MMIQTKISNQEAKRPSLTHYTVVVAPSPKQVSNNQELSNVYYRPSFVGAFEQMKTDKVSPKMYQFAHFTLQCMYDVANKQDKVYRHPLGCKLKKWDCVFTTTYFWNNSQGKQQFDEIFDKNGNKIDKNNRHTQTLRALKLLKKYGLITEKFRFATREKNKKQYVVYSLKKTCTKGLFEEIDVDNPDTYQRGTMIQAVLAVDANAKHIQMKKEEYKNGDKVSFAKFANSASRRIDAMSAKMVVLNHSVNQQQERIQSLEDDNKRIKLMLKKMQEEITQLKQNKNTPNDDCIGITLTLKK